MSEEPEEGARGALRYTQAPDELAPLFRHGELLIERFFSGFAQEPGRATVSVGGERYLLVRAASLSVQFYDLVRDVLGSRLTETAAKVAAREVLYDLAHAMGRADAREILGLMNLTDPLMRVAVGTSHFAHTGWGRVRIRGESSLEDLADLCLHYDHENSFEADAYLAAEQRSTEPVCVMNAGYSAGWVSESFGVELSACEITCRAQGDESCRFVMADAKNLQRRLRETAARLNRPQAATPSYLSGERLIDKVVLAEAARDLSLQSLRALFENAPFGAFLVEVREGDLVLVDANSAADEVLGRDCTTDLGAPVRVTFPPAAELEAIQRAILAGERRRHHEPQLRCDGGDDVFDVHLFLFEPGRLAILFRDVSEEVRSDGVALASQRLEATSTLAGGIAHDFNNLMAGVLGHVAFLRRVRPGWDEIDAALQRLEQVATHGSGLAQQLLGHARGGKYLDERLELNALASEVVEAQGEARIELDLRATTDQISGDPTQLRALLLALLRNALEAVEREGSIVVGTEVVEVKSEQALGLELTAGAFVVLEVRDEGPGMEPGVLDRAFEPYFSTKAPGRGLGLAAAYGVVRNHGGALRIDSAPGKGTCVQAYLPCAGSRNFSMEELTPLRGKGWVERQGSLEAVGSMALGIAQQLGDLINTAISAHDSAVAAESPEERESACSEAKRALDESHALVGRLTALGLNSVDRRDHVDLNELCREVALQTADSLGQGTELRLELAPYLPSLFLARAQVSNALAHLVFNARDSLSLPGQVVISTWLERDEWVAVEVHHGSGGTISGSGVSAPAASGLGLPMAERVARAHEGELHVVSAASGGTRVRLLFPRALPANTPLAKPRLRVLVVDDNEHVARSTVQLLELEGLSAVDVSSGEEALKRCSQESFDVVLLDFLLPGMSGRETFKLLRAQQPELPIVVFSGFGDQADVRSLVEQEHVAFLAKPFVIDDLCRVLRSVTD